MKPNQSNLSLDHIKVRVSSKIKDHSNDPFVVQKGEDSIKTLKRVGFPSDLVNERFKK